MWISCWWGVNSLAASHPRRHAAAAIIRSVWCLIVALSATTGAAAAQGSPLPSRVHRIVFLGDSITYGGGYAEWVEAWLRIYEPDREIECLNLGLPSETVSGLSEPGHAGGAFPRPDLHERLERVLSRGKPDFIFAAYGMNDGIYHPFSEERFEAFRSGLQRLREKAAAAGVPIVHLTPTVFDAKPLAGRTLPEGQTEYRQPFDGYDDVLARYSAWLVEQRSAGWTVIDIHTPMRDFLDARRRENPAFRLADDGVHIDAQGHWLVAREILRWLGAPDRLALADDDSEFLRVHPRAADVLEEIRRSQRLLKDAWLTRVGHLRPGMNPGEPLEKAVSEAKENEAKIRALARNPFPGRRSTWFDFDRYDFTVNGRPALVVAPHREAPGRPWVWHGEFFGHKPDPDLALLGRGFHIVYMSVPDMLGSPEAVRHWSALHEELTSRYGLAEKAALVGLSRGGLYCYNWAIANPNRVACIYGDAPVCDFRSWPGGKGRGPGSPRDWRLLFERYGFSSDEEALGYKGNPVDNLAPLARAGVPILHVYGDADEVVPWEENTGVVASRYRELGGPITLIAKPGGRHHPHGLDDSTPIVNFILRHAGGVQSDANAVPANTVDRGPLDAEGRPLIRRLGTVDLDLVETTPVVFRGELWRFEWVREGYWANSRRTNYFRFRNPATGETSPPFADGHEFGSAFVHDGRMLVTGTQGRDRVNLFITTDLKSWETRPLLPPGRYGIFNTTMCRTPEDFVLMFEIDRPSEETGVPFTARFLRSADLTTWTLTPPECNYSKDRYTAPHGLRWHDGWFYNFYLEAHDGYEMRVVRSRDLVRWEPSPLNPVMRRSPLDRRLTGRSWTEDQRRRVATAINRNNSDIDFCEWQGRLTITYSWGNQLGVEHLAEAVYDGNEAQFVNAWFPEEAAK